MYDRQIRLWGLEAQQRCARLPTPHLHITRRQIRELCTAPRDYAFVFASPVVIALLAIY